MEKIRINLTNATIKEMNNVNFNDARIGNHKNIDTKAEDYNGFVMETFPPLPKDFKISQFFCDKTITEITLKTSCFQQLLGDPNLKIGSWYSIISPQDIHVTAYTNVLKAFSQYYKNFEDYPFVVLKTNIVCNSETDFILLNLYASACLHIDIEYKTTNQ